MRFFYFQHFKKRRRPMINKERIEKSELFAGLSEESLQALAEICEPETGPKGALLCQDGAVAEK